MTKLAEEIKYIVDVLAPYAKMQSVQINTNIADHDCYVVGERQKLRQCLINVVKNCIESISNKGTIHIDMMNDMDQVLIEIRDTGCGMTSEQIQQMGTPYCSTKEKGTGLGMVVVLNIIKSMNGKLNIRSEKEKGTLFSITFPLVHH